MTNFPFRRRFICLNFLLLLFASCTVSVNPESTQAAPTVTAAPASAMPSAEQSQIQARIPLPQGASLIAFGDGWIWISNAAERSVARIDIGSSQNVHPPIALDFEPREIAFGEGAVWVCSADRTQLARIDPQTGEVVTVIDLDSLEIPTYNYVILAAGEGAVWLTNQTTVIQIDPQTNQIVGEPLEAGEEIISVALGHGTLWTGSHDDGIVTRIDAKTRSIVAKIDMGFSVHGLAVSEGSAWVLDEHGFGVVRVDPQNNQIRERVPIDFVGSNLAAGTDSVWVAPAARDSGQATGVDGIARINESEKRVVETIHVGDAATSEYYSVFFYAGSVWVMISTPQMTVVQITP